MAASASKASCLARSSAPGWLVHVALIMLLLLTLVLTYQYLVRPAILIQQLRAGATRGSGGKETFADDASTAKARLVFLHMDGCGWCVKFQPTWDDLGGAHGKALQAAGVTLEDHESKSAESKALAEKAGAKGYPTILLVIVGGKDDGKIVKFEGDRTVKGLLAFLQQNGFHVDEKKESFYAVERAPSGADQTAADAGKAVDKATPSKAMLKEQEKKAGSKQPNPYE